MQSDIAPTQIDTTEPVIVPEDGEPEFDWQYVSLRSRVKRSVDWAAALVLLVATGPIMLVCMVLVKLTSRGPAIYSQIRLGQGRRPFRIYKIRTMTHNCEATTGARWAAVNDSRITTIGRFLRRSHLDELP